MRGNKDISPNSTLIRSTCSNTIGSCGQDVELYPQDITLSIDPTMSPDGVRSTYSFICYQQEHDPNGLLVIKKAVPEAVKLLVAAEVKVEYVDLTGYFANLEGQQIAQHQGPMIKDELIDLMNALERLDAIEAFKRELVS